MDNATIAITGYALLAIIVVSLFIFIQGEVKRRSSPVTTRNKNAWALIPICLIGSVFLLLFGFLAFMFRNG